MSEISDRIRKQFKEGDDIRDAGLKEPEDVKCCRDIVYGKDEKWQSLDVYRPKEAEDVPLPVIVSVHGGGWVYGDKERYRFYCMSLAQRGFAVVNFSYRLAPENKFPASLEDTNAVFTWVLAHKEEYAFDTEHIFAVGDSAGAHNLALYCCILTNQSYAAEYSFKTPRGFCPKAVALNCGKYNVSPQEGEDLETKELMKDYLPQGGTLEEMKRICAVDYITAAFPPVFLMTATGDFLTSQALVMAEKLMEKSVPFELHFYGDESHILGHVFHCNMKLPEAAKCNDEECAFFGKFM